MTAAMVHGLILALVGLVVGSFLANVSVRLPADEDVVLGRSRCRSCGAQLKTWNLIPVVSWAVQRGRCAGCGARVSARYPLIELACGGIGLWAGLAGGGWPVIAATALLGWQLLLIAVVDGEHFWLPDVLTLPLIATGLAAAVLLDRGAALDHLIGALAGFGVLWLLAFAYKRLRDREGLGGGDPILFAGCGAWVGWLGLPSVLLWACLAAFSLILARLILRKPVSGTDRLPFGVFLAIGTWLVWLLGPIGL